MVRVVFFLVSSLLSRPGPRTTKDRVRSGHSGQFRSRDCTCLHLHLPFAREKPSQLECLIK